MVPQRGFEPLTHALRSLCAKASSENLCISDVNHQEKRVALQIRDSARGEYSSSSVERPCRKCSISASDRTRASAAARFRPFAPVDGTMCAASPTRNKRPKRMGSDTKLRNGAMLCPVFAQRHGRAVAFFFAKWEARQSKISEVDSQFAVRLSFHVPLLSGDPPLGTGGIPSPPVAVPPSHFVATNKYPAWYYPIWK
jgi:hypothetical protein